MSYQFHGQRPHEEVLLIVRRHPFVLLKPFIISALFVLLPFAILIFFPVGYVLSISVIMCLILAIVVSFTAWHQWRSTLLLLTNERVVFLEQKSILKREFVECGLGTIQQVSHTVQGLLGTTMGYGTITIATGGISGIIKIPDIPDPYEIQQEIQRAASGDTES